jgi:predicted metal-binding protein/uncharacterized membrane protein
LLKSGGSSAANIAIGFTNDGTVTNLEGVLDFNSGGALIGTYDTAAGATIDFSSGSFTMGAPPVISGSGVCEFSGTTLTLTQNEPTNLVLAGGNLILGPAFQSSSGITNLTLTGVTLISTNTVTGTLNWASGAVAGQMTIGSGGVLNISGSVGLENVLTNAGTVTMTGAAYLTVYNNNSSEKGGIYNLAGALWNIQTNATITCGSCEGYEFFNNAGSLLKSGGSSAANIAIGFTNDGTVTNLEGVLDFNSGGALIGTYDTAAGATIDFSSGSFTMGAPPVISGSGVCEFSGTTLTLTQNEPTNLVLAGGNLILGPAFQSSSGITNLTLTGVTLISTNTVTGTLNWASGAVAGQMTIGSGGVLNISGSVGLENVLTNAGTVTMTGAAYLTVYNNNSSEKGGIYNLAGALWNIQTNATITCGSCEGYEFFNNAGSLLKSGGSSAANIAIGFTNDGTVTNLEGVLDFNSGGALIGTYDTAAGATIDFSSGSFTMGAPPVISGSGVCEFSGTTLTLTQNEPTNLVLAGGNLILGPAFQSSSGITNLTLTGVTLISTNTVTGTLNWASGAVAGQMTIASGGVLNISGSVGLENVLTNAGTVTMTGAAYLTVYNNNSSEKGGIYNLAGALWNIQTNATITCGSCEGYEFFNNAGSLLKSGGSSAANIAIGFTNDGTVTNLEGVLDFNSGGALIGTYDTAAGATIDFSSGSFTMGAPPVISGSGVCEFSGTTLTLTQNEPTNLVLAGGNLILGPAFQSSSGITNLTLTGVTLISTNTVTGTLNWASGAVAGQMTIGSGGVLNISGSVGLENVLTNAGTVTMTGAAYLTVYNNNSSEKGGIYNLAGALWNIQTNATITCGSCEGYEFFNNAGTLRRSQGTSTATISITFTNTATVDAQVGALSFNENFVTAGGTLAFGVSSLGSFGQINVSGNVALNGTVSAEWLNGFTPAVGNTFAVLHYGSESGTFANISLPAGDLGEGIYGATVFSLMITNITAQSNSPVFLDIKLANLGNVVVSWPSSATNYNLQVNTNLSSESWSNVINGITTAGGNFVLTNPVNGKASFFRLQSP